MLEEMFRRLELQIVLAHANDVRVTANCLSPPVSNVLYKDMVLQCCDHNGPAFLVALDRKSGARSVGARRGSPAPSVTMGRRW